MKGKIIKDIRLYKSESQNEFGIPATVSFADKKLNATTQRIVMKLRENNFSFGDFDHLYINFTTCDMAEEISLSEKTDTYHPWYRYCNVRIDTNSYANLGSEENCRDIINYISTILITYFTSEDFDKSKILTCVKQALDEGEDMLMKFKEKITSQRKAIIYLRYLDTCKFYPLLRIYDTEEHLLFEKDLPEALTLDYIGDIQISTKKITIKPRKNVLNTEEKAMVFEY